MYATHKLYTENIENKFDVLIR